MTRTRNRKGAGGELRTELLNAAKRVFEATHSAESITIRRVAAECEVSQAAIYLHFSSRDELVHDVALELFNTHYEVRAERLALVMDPVERIVQFGIAYTDFALTHRELFHALLMGNGNEKDPSRFDGLDLLEHTGLGDMVHDVEHAMEAKAIAPGDPHLVASLLWMSMHGAAALHISLPGYPLPPVEVSIAAMVAFTANAVKHPVAIRQDIRSAVHK